MIATVLPAVIIVFVALVFLAAIETTAWCLIVSRYKRRREFTNLITELPPVPAPAPKPDTDADWFASWACDTPLSVIEAAYWHREFLRIPEVAADLGLTS